MKRMEAEQIIASYSVGENPFAALPPSTLVFVRRGLVPKPLMKSICARCKLRLSNQHFYSLKISMILCHLSQVLAPSSMVRAPL